MTNDEDDLARLRQGVAVWNAWRAQNPDRPIDLSGANLTRANLTRANLTRANLTRANLTGANLIKTNLMGSHLGGARFDRANLIRANFIRAYLSGAYLIKANLSGAHLSGANLYGVNLSRAHLGGADFHKAHLRGANLSGTDLREANLSGADLREANLTGANLIKANLSAAILIETNLTDADLTGCRVYGISAWGLKLNGAKQRDLVVSAPYQPEITVDNIEVGQFICLLIHNEKIRTVIDTITSKVVLILGRFTPERKAVLDALRVELREYNYLPVLFDFPETESRDITETVSLLARMARFIIADLTDPSSIPKELEAIVPGLAVPVQPLIEGSSRPFAMFKDYWKYDWVLPVYRYSGLETLLTVLAEKVVAPAETKLKTLEERRRAIEAELMKDTPSPFA